MPNGLIKKRGNEHTTPLKQKANGRFFVCVMKRSFFILEMMILEVFVTCSKSNPNNRREHVKEQRLFVEEKVF